LTKAEAIEILQRFKERVVTDDLETTCRVERENEAIDIAVACIEDSTDRICEIAEKYGLTQEGVDYALEQYQNVIVEITDGFFSKLTYDARTICNKAYECYEAAFLEDRKFAVESAPIVTFEKKWISVLDRIPEPGSEVLVFAKPKDNSEPKVAITYMTTYNFLDSRCDVEPYWVNPWQYFSFNYDITHWQELPDGPKEEE